MQQFLTNGGRSIPKLICLDADHHVLWHWGPRPASAVKLLEEVKAEGLDAKEAKEKLHLWYARNKQVDLQQELYVLIDAESA
jgi:hypothetical protein